MSKIYCGTLPKCTLAGQKSRMIPLQKEVVPLQGDQIFPMQLLTGKLRLISSKVIPLICLLLCSFVYSQTEVYFKYDEAGNQRYRGPDVAAAKTPENTAKSITSSLPTSQVMDEKAFWKQLRLYPVPVNDYLTIDWTEEVDGLIESVSLYQHSTVHWKFQQQNIPGLNRQVKINMTGYDWGIYILRFTLKDGRVFGKNITKR